MLSDWLGLTDADHLAKRLRSRERTGVRQRWIDLVVVVFPQIPFEISDVRIDFNLREHSPLVPRYE